MNEAEKLNGKVVNPLNATLQMGLRSAFWHHQNGRLTDAEVQCQQILQIHPLHADALHLLGVIAHQTGRSDMAVELLRKAINAKPAENTLYYNLGCVLKEQGEFMHAADAFRQSISIRPDPDTLNNLGIVLRAQGKIADAANSYRQALMMKPGFAEAHNNLGNALRESGNIEEATACFQQALLYRPNYPEALGNLAATLNLQGKLDDAIHSYLLAFRLGSNATLKVGFAQCIKDVTFATHSHEIHALLLRAISEAWTIPAELWIPAMSMVSLNARVGSCIAEANQVWARRLGDSELLKLDNFSAVVNEPLLQCLIENTPCMDMETERFLTMTRRVLLDLALRDISPAPQPELVTQELAFFSALARQCFINEYIFSTTEGETAEVDKMQIKLEACLEHDSAVPSSWLIAFASYRPLHKLLSSQVLLAHTWPEPVAFLVAQQIQEPLTEHSIAEKLPQLTTIEEGVSRNVQAQYEASPYPRWVRSPIEPPIITVDRYFGNSFPHSPFQPLGNAQGPAILIAGCGTGQHAIQTARTFRDARILAIDLSLASLSYAKRKTTELGIKNIEYAQADILKLGELQQTFDIVECVGVLHHLSAPVAGWRELLRVLAPGGLMRVGLYSELARQTVVAARNFIALHKFGSSPVDIRQCRQDLMSPENESQFKPLQMAGDFYAMSGCRDLLFHVQEHRFTLPQIESIFEELGLELIGLEVDATIAKEYRAHFPQDVAMVNLGYWHEFEVKHPNTFSNMYQFWVQKKVST